MKAVVCKDAELKVVELPEVPPGRGQVLLKVLRCGICGSDLHVRHHCSHYGSLLTRIGYKNSLRDGAELVFGHEFCGEILEHGSGTKRKLPVGTRVAALPIVRTADNINIIGLAADSPGAYAERVLTDEIMLLAIPNGLHEDQAAMTEPMAVALHAVNRADVKKGDVAIVIGCGPVGLGVICMLKAQGVHTVVASDFSAGRRELAKRCGADLVIDPSTESPYKNWQEYGHIAEFSALFELALDTREKLGKLPVPWWHAWRLAEKLGRPPKRPVIFECVGVPGILSGIMDGAPLFSRIVAVGVCMQEDRFEPALGIHKEIDLRFVIGYSPLEFHDALHMIAEGKVNCAPMVTGRVGLEGVENAFAALADPDKHAKILIDPGSHATQP